MADRFERQPTGSVDDDDEDQANRPTRDAGMYPWQVKIGLAGDFYRSIRVPGSKTIFQWVIYEPNGPISFHPELSGPLDASTITTPTPTPIPAPTLTIMAPERVPKAKPAVKRAKSNAEELPKMDFAASELVPAVHNRISRSGAISEFTVKRGAEEYVILSGKLSNISNRVIAENDLARSHYTIVGVTQINGELGLVAQLLP